MQLTEEELRDVLARAEEIQRGIRHGTAWNAEVAAVVGAGEEIGLSRYAIERALGERLDLPAAPPAEGDLVWARSTDGKFYPSQVVGVGDSDARVKFLGGGVLNVPLDGVRPCRFVPGEKVSCEWPWWGPYVGTVVKYDAERERVELSDGWGSVETFPIAELWIEPPKPASQKRLRRTLMLRLAAAAGVGATLGAIVTALLMR